MDIHFFSDCIRKTGHDFVYVNGVRYMCSEKLQKQLSFCSSDREYSEMVEYTAHRVFIEKSQENDDLFLSASPET